MAQKGQVRQEVHRRASWSELIAGRIEEALRQQPVFGLRVERCGGACVAVRAVKRRAGPGQWPRPWAAIAASVLAGPGEEELLRHLVDRNFGYLDRSHREAICREARRLLDALQEGSLGGLERERYIETRLWAHLSECSTLHVEGFVRFRLREYLELLEDAVERAADRIFLAWDHGGCAALLRHFVELQEPRMEQVHVVAGEEGYRLYDSQGRAVERSLCLDVVVETEADREDALLGALASLAPRQVVLHDPAGRVPPATWEMLRQIWPQCLEPCPGCRLCGSHYAPSPEKR